MTVAGRLTWGGHATVRIELAGRAVLTDPVLAARIGHLRRLAPPPAGITDGLAAVLISHLHRDHLDMPTLRRIDPAVPVVAPEGAAPLLRLARRAEVIEVGPGDTVDLGDVRVHVTPAEHDGGAAMRGVHPRRVPHVTALGFVVAGAGRRVYFAGDTDLFAGMADLAPGLDAALLPVGGWGPTLGPGHLDVGRAAEALALLRPRLAVPVHWGTYAPFGIPARTGYLRTPGAALARAAAGLAPEVEVRVLAPGGSTGLGEEASGA